MKIKNLPYFFLFIAYMIAILSCSAPKALEYTNYSNFKISSLGFTNSKVSIDLQYFNPNNFGLQLKRTELDIYLNNTYLGHSISDSLVNIPRRDTFSIPVKFVVDMRNVFKNAYTTLMGNGVTVKVDGKIKVGKANVFMSMPVKYEGVHKFSIF